MDKRFKFGIFYSMQSQEAFNVINNHSIDLHLVRISNISDSGIIGSAVDW